MTLLSTEARMILERAEISGFRGLAKLAVNFTDRTVLIGENAWGKSSLLRALLSVFGEIIRTNLKRQIFVP